MIKLDFIPVEFIKFFFLVFFLSFFTFYDVFYGKIKNKMLIIFLILGLVINILFDRENLIKILATMFFTFLISYIFWELSFLTPGDVKLLTLIPLYLPYNTQINPMVSVSIIIISVFFLYFLFIFVKKLVKKEIKFSLILEEIKKYLKNINYLLFFEILFSLSVLFYFIQLNIFLSFLLIFLVFIGIDKFIEKYEIEKNYLFFVIFVVSLIPFFKFEFYKDINFYKNLFLLAFLIIFLRIPLYISSYFVSTKKVNIENLKEGNKLALIPIKLGNKYTLYRLIPYNLFSIFYAKKYAIDNYDPSLGLQKENLKSIRRFFKMNHIKKVEIFEETPFVPFIFVSVLIFYFYYFYTLFLLLSNS